MQILFFEEKNCTFIVAVQKKMNEDPSLVFFDRKSDNGIGHMQYGSAKFTYEGFFNEDNDTNDDAQSFGVTEKNYLKTFKEKYLNEKNSSEISQLAQASGEFSNLFNDLNPEKISGPKIVRNIRNVPDIRNVPKEPRDNVNLEKFENLAKKIGISLNDVEYTKVFDNKTRGPIPLFNPQKKSSSSPTETSSKFTRQDVANHEKTLKNRHRPFDIPEQSENVFYGAIQVDMDAQGLQKQRKNNVFNIYGAQKGISSKKK